MKLTRYFVLFLLVVCCEIDDVKADYSVYFDSVSPIMQSEDSIIFDGVRIDGFGFSSEDDALRLEYNFDYNTLNFVLDTSAMEIYSNIGVFHEEHMAIDVDVPQPDYTVGDNNYHFDQSYNFEATDSTPFIAKLNLDTGHVISWFISDPSSDYSYQIIGENVDYSFLGKASSGVISGANKILKSGEYQLVVKPEDSLSLTCSLKLFNANNRQLEIIENGDSISVSFEKNIRDYAKYKVRLNTGDKLNLPAPSDSNIKIKLVDNLGKMIINPAGLALIYESENDSEYYLFIYNNKGWGGSYGGNVTITNDSAKTKRRKTHSIIYIDHANTACK